MNAKSTQDNRDPVIVIVKSDGSLHLKLSGDDASRSVDAAQLEAMLRPIREQQGEALRVLVAGDADVSYQRVLDAMEALRKANVTNVSLMTQAGGDAR